MKDRPTSVRSALYSNPAALRAAAKTLLRGAYAGGHLSDDDLAGLSIGEVEDYLVDNPHRFRVIIDHRPALLEEATRYKEEGEVLNSVLFFALYFEHSANYLIYNAARRSDLDDQATRQMIRTVNLEGKVSWALRLVGLPELNPKHRKVILRIAAERNAYVHYKFPAVDDMFQGGVESLDRLLDQARKTVTYCRWFESRFLWKKKVPPLS